MRRNKAQGRFEDKSLDRPEEDRGAVTIALLAAAISGFFVGLLTKGEIAFAVAVAVLVPVTGCAGWWLRWAFERDECRAER
jgi:hypothetical protein